MGEGAYRHLEEMTFTNRLSVCMIGAGNVASHLSLALSGIADVRQIVSRHLSSAQNLAMCVGNGCKPSVGLESVHPGCDLYVISVNDGNIREVACGTPDFPGIWVHTSGSVPADVFKGLKSRYGVLYPLQTFTRGVYVDMSEVPFFIEGSDALTEDALAVLAGKLSSTVEVVDSDRRRALHVAAVFACNFTNLMWIEADGILRKRGLSMDRLLPLLKATIDKLYSVPPYVAMTGPARRGDMAVIESHLQMLPPEQKEIYKMLSERIMQLFPTQGIHK